MKSLQELQRTWEGLAQADPLWAICTDPAKQNRRWSREEFFATGKNELGVVLRCLAELGVSIDGKAPALDFGCGVGRLTRALAEHFAECWGVDISPTMITLAKEFNRDLPQCRFLLNERDKLQSLQDNYFGFIYTSIVLQHMAERYIRGYIAELVRVLRPGGVLVFQLPDSLRGSVLARIRTRVALRARLLAVLRKQGPPVMEMHCIREPAVRQLVWASGARVVEVRLTNSSEPSFGGNLQYLKEEPQAGFVSKQYCVVKGK
ncbi:MAG TPA: class I SAM-dependent methyltransferase [Candidatus Angelobacter sp.]|nr:class I SAM-dependent methyltransferase [Candidatus Angelobacter sp.]